MCVVYEQRGPRRSAITINFEVPSQSISICSSWQNGEFYGKKSILWQYELHSILHREMSGVVVGKLTISALALSSPTSKLHP